MKQIITTLFAALMAIALWAQSPQAFNYQAVIRDANGNLLENQAVGIKISLLQGSATGQEVYAETHATTTNPYGLVDLKIGTGTATTGQFDTIAWGAGPYYLQLAVDLTGGANYAVMGTTQMLSVPYALYAEEGSGWEKTEDGITYLGGKVGIGHVNYDAKFTVGGNFYFNDECYVSENDENYNRNYIWFRYRDSVNYYGSVNGLMLQSSLYQNSTVGTVSQPRYMIPFNCQSNVYGTLNGNLIGVWGRSYVRTEGTVTGNAISVVGSSVNAGNLMGDLIGIYGTTINNGTITGKRWAGKFEGNTYITGNLGIQTDNPTYPLTVNGTIRSKKVIVDTGWSDFVFDDDYKLMPLHEVEAFIKTNRHLPEIPSAKEVEENGVSLGEISASLLQKIEELTLYAIEQQKVIDKLVKENEEMGRRVKKIEKNRNFKRMSCPEISLHKN
jgi:hypothetical protein